jgi:hypothetical protein
MESMRLPRLLQGSNEDLHIDFAPGKKSKVFEVAVQYILQFISHVLNWVHIRIVKTFHSYLYECYIHL